MRISTRNISTTLAVVIQMTLAINASATVLTFDDSREPGRSDFVTDLGLGDIDVNKSLAPGVVSGDKLLLGGTMYAQRSTIRSASSSIPGGQFDFNGAYLTSINGEGLLLLIEARRDGGQAIYSRTVELTHNQPVYYSFNFEDVDAISFTPYWIDGYRKTSDGSKYITPSFTLDNFTYNEPFTSTDPGTPTLPLHPSTPVPEPMTLALFGIGLAGMAAGQHRKTRSGAKIATRAPGIC